MGHFLDTQEKQKKNSFDLNETSAQLINKDKGYKF